MAIRKIPPKDVNLITTTSTLRSPCHVVKELIDNSIDALGDTDMPHITIEIDSTSGGLDYISVKDNGSGIEKNDRSKVCLNYATSKIKTYDDLEAGISTLGFRGEGLFCISQNSDLTISTKTEDDEIGQEWAVDKYGQISSLVESLAASKGTSVIVKKLFGNLPVRKKHFKKQRRKTLESVHDLIVSYSLAYKSIRFNLKYVELLHNQKPLMKTNFVLNPSISQKKILCNLLKVKESQFFEINEKVTLKNGRGHNYDVSLYALLPMRRAQDADFPKSGFKSLSVNGRPLNISLTLGKDVSSLINKVYQETMLLLPTSWNFSIDVPLEHVEINVEPEKSDVMIANMDHLLALMKDLLVSEVSRAHGLNTNENDVKISEPVSRFSTPGFKTKPDFYVGSQYKEQNYPVQVREKTLSETTSSSCNNTTLNLTTPTSFTTHEDCIPMVDIGESTKSTTNVEKSNWSFSMCDPTSISSDGTAPEDYSQSIANNAADEDLTIIDDISINNPFTITKLKSRSLPRTFLYPTPLSRILTGSKVPTNVSTTTAKSLYKPKTLDNVSQNISFTGERKTKVANLSENTLHEECNASIEELIHFSPYDLYLKEAQWVDRKGFPSFPLTEGYKELINRLDTSVNSDTKVLLNKTKGGWYSASY